MAEDSVFDSGLSGVLGESSGTRKSAEWETDLLGSLSEDELKNLMSEHGDGDTVRMASAADPLDPEVLEDELRRDVKRVAAEGRDVSDDLATLAAEMESEEQDRWGAVDGEIARFVTGRLYAGQSPKQIEGLLRLMHPAARVEAFWAARGDEVMSKYGRLGFLYVDASDFQDDVEMDEMLGGQKKIGQMALEAIKPASRCGDCTLNRGGFCMRYNLSLDTDPTVKSVRQARRVLNKFARVSEAADRQVSQAQEAVDAAESKALDPKEYDRIVSAFLTDIGRPRTPKGDTGRPRMPGAAEASSRPQPQPDAGVEGFVREKLSRNPGATFAELRGGAMSKLGAQRAKAWFRSNRSLVSQLVEAAARGQVSAEQEQEICDTMDKVRETLVARHGERRAERIMEARGDDPSRYASILSRPAETETRRIDTGRQMPRTMPDTGKSRVIGHLDDDLRSAAEAAAARGVPQDGIRSNLLSLFGEKRVAAFEADCPDDIGDMVRRANLGFGADDDPGARFFEECLERTGGDLDAAVLELRRSLGRRRAKLLLSQHPGVETAVAAASRTHGEAAGDAADRRIANSGNAAARPLVPESSIDFDMIAREAAATIDPEPELRASDLPPAKLDPTLVAHPEMDNVEPGYTVPDDLPGPAI